MNKKILVIFLVIFLGLSLAIYQYAKVLQTDLANAYSTSKPANGHSWAEMQCTEGLCVTADNKVGVGTDNPTEKFQVTGNIKASGDICNGTGNCLSALATLTNACGGAATNYSSTATEYSGSYCIMGAPTPTSPSFPVSGGSTTWTCPVANGSPISCTATRAANGSCGAAATSYAYSASSFSGALCSTGTASPASPSFPGQGGSVSWSCLGINGGASPSCTASRGTAPIEYLIGGIHTTAQCGSVFDTGSGKICAMGGSSCPTGWTQYQSYSSTSSVTIAAGSDYCYSNANPCSWSSCTTGSHAFSNAARESCNPTNGCANCYYGCCYGSWPGPGPFYATITAVGCY